MIKRKGFRKQSDIPASVLKRLNSGEETTQTLVEWLVVDRGKLLKTVYSEFDLGTPPKEILDIISSGDFGVMEIVKKMGEFWLGIIKEEKSDLFEDLKNHRSDIVREWAAGSLMANDKLTLKKRFDQTKSFAVDPNMNVREIAWYTLRPYIEKNLEKAVELFGSWVTDPREGIRRCAIEGTRPNGVWCKHLKKIQKNPEICLDLLNQVNSDKSDYVRKSVGNWLNDESKHNPEWVKQICKKWEKTSQTKETEWVIKHALRTLRKKNLL